MFEIPAPSEFRIGFNVNKGTAAREKCFLFHIPVLVSANEVIWWYSDTEYKSDTLVIKQLIRYAICKVN